MTTMLNCFVAVCCGLPLSAACTVNVLVPVTAGAPVIWPADESVSPAGKTEPVANDQVSGAVPPLAVSVAEYD